RRGARARLSDQGRADHAAVRPRRDSAALREAAAVRALPRPRALLPLQGPAADRDAERLRLPLSEQAGRAGAGHPEEGRAREGSERDGRGGGERGPAPRGRCRAPAAGRGRRLEIRLAEEHEETGPARDRPRGRGGRRAARRGLVLAKTTAQPVTAAAGWHRRQLYVSPELASAPPRHSLR